MFEPVQVSVVVPTHTGETNLSRCLDSVFQSKRLIPENVEVLIVAPHKEVLSASLSMPDGVLVRWLETGRLLGPSAARNAGWKQAQGKYCFFVDSDCVVTVGWLQAGLRFFSNPSVGGVEGPIIYDNAAPTIRDRIPINPIYNLSFTKGLNPPMRDFAAANIAYRRDLLEQVAGFDAERFENGREDTDLGFKISRLNTISFVPEMAVVHRRGEWTRKLLIENARRYQSDVTFFSVWKDFPFRWGRILHPHLLLMMLFPPYFFKTLLPWIHDSRDLRFSFSIYGYLWRARWNIWKAAFRHYTFVV